MTRVDAGILRSALATTLEMLFPRRCIACHGFYRRAREPSEGTGFNPDQEGARRDLTAFLCPGCALDIRPIASPLCPGCGVPFATSAGEDHICGRCLKHPPSFQRARSACFYEGGLRMMIHHLKYKGYAQAAAPLGGILWEAFKKNWEPEQIDFVVPVPLHKKRLRRRGFNQAEQLIRPWPALARREGIQFHQGNIGGRLLVRRHNTPPQTGLDSRQRVDNVKAAFRVREPSVVRGRCILLVDDVLTTGATVQACAKALTSSGASKVHVLTLARSV